MKEVKNQENQLPLLAQTGDICRKPYTDKNSEANVWRKFSMEELGKKLEHDLLQIPTFKAPYTTTSSPARLLSCEVVSEPDERGVFTAFIEFLPGDNVEKYCFLEAMGLEKIDLAEVGLADFDFSSRSIEDSLEELEAKIKQGLLTRASKSKSA